MLEELTPFVGEWDVSVPFSEARGRAIFQWTLDGAFLVQRTEIPVPDAPNSLIVYARHEGRYAQHYFDSRGVVRRYEMTLEGNVWTLWRDDPVFAQRWTATVGTDAIEGTWEASEDGGTWRKDFDLTYRRLGSLS